MTDEKKETRWCKDCDYRHDDKRCHCEAAQNGNYVPRKGTCLMWIPKKGK